MWAHAVEQAGTPDIAAVRQAMIGQKMRSPSGYEVRMGSNHFISKPLVIGEVQADGQFNIVYQTKDVTAPKAWSSYVDSNKGKGADWSWPWARGGCAAPKYMMN